ncbi:diacylglycerol kinase family protein [Pelagicoccus mobilis]|uniref:Diacylglycerol kinase family protein n=1 Tax=Pelagicoccus mobilis TaxID=415221 RepID=A0A934RXG2_9BACT|nr:diacylglycerol kinase family protein [Pelagicoccus mobilis]MBK1875358.1 diacylglycerol kinase family protein [Pelagicoccus mobilis]
MKNRIQSFAHALRGIREFIALGANAKLQCLAALAIIVVGLILQFTRFEWIAVILCIGSVLAAEAINTAIEELANEVTEEKSERIRRVKDIAAGAVLILSLASLVVAILIILNRLN